MEGESRIMFAFLFLGLNAEEGMSRKSVLKFRQDIIFFSSPREANLIESFAKSFSNHNLIRIFLNSISFNCKYVLSKKGSYLSKLPHAV